MQVNSNINVALTNEKEHAALGAELVACGLHALTESRLDETGPNELLLYSNDDPSRSRAVTDWIWLHHRAPLVWIGEWLQRGARQIFGAMDSEKVKPDIFEGLKSGSWFVQFHVGEPDFDIDTAANLLASILKLADFNSEREQKKLRVVALEAITNAWEHGYEKDESKMIKVTYEVSAEGMGICVEHQGLGFDPADVPDPMAPENLFSESGRGILIMKNTLDQLDYEDGGRRLVGAKKFSTNM